MTGIDEMHDELPKHSFARLSEEFNLRVMTKAREEDDAMLFSWLRHYQTILATEKDAKKRQTAQKQLNGNPKVKAEVLHTQVCCLDQTRNGALLVVQLVSFRTIVVKGKCRKPKLDMVFKFDVASFRKLRKDGEFVHREKGYLGRVKARAAQYGQAVRRLFAGWEGAGATMFPKNELRTDERVFLCHYRAHSWLKRLKRNDIALAVYRVKEQDSFDVMFQVCSPPCVSPSWWDLWTLCRVVRKVELDP